jgi:hypothetical protein
MSNPYIIQRRANAWGDLEQTFHIIDAKRFEYLAEVLTGCGQHGAARYAAQAALEHRMTADRLSGAVAVGSDVSVLA